MKRWQDDIKTRIDEVKHDQRVRASRRIAGVAHTAGIYEFKQNREQRISSADRTSRWPEGEARES